MLGGSINFFPLVPPLGIQCGDQHRHAFAGANAIWSEYSEVAVWRSRCRDQVMNRTELFDSEHFLVVRFFVHLLVVVREAGLELLVGKVGDLLGLPLANHFVHMDGRSVQRRNELCQPPSPTAKLSPRRVHRRSSSLVLHNEQVMAGYLR